MRQLLVTSTLLVTIATSLTAQSVEAISPAPTVIVNPAPANTVSTPIGNVPAGALQLWNIGAVGLTIFSLMSLAGETESAGGTF